MTTITFSYFCRDGADLSIINACNKTPLECLLRNISADEIKNLIRSGCYYNVYNIETEEGCIAYTLRRYTGRFADIKRFMSMIVKNFSQSIQTDEVGRTAVHNIVSTKDHSGFSANEYAALIEQLSKAGFDVDDQDKSGKI